MEELKKVKEVKIKRKKGKRINMEKKRATNFKS